jgi:thiamine-monophosphate kinase
MPSPESRRIQLMLEAARRHTAVPGSGVVSLVGVASLDDCAVLPYSATHDLLIGSDFVRGEGFDLFKAGLLSRRDVGYYLVGANISDIAAMGGSPIGIVVATRYSPDLSDEDFAQLADGIAAACSEMGAPLLGGDTGGYNVSVLSAAALGLVPKDAALLRNAARSGDLVFLTGTVGTAGAAFELVRAGWDRFSSISPEAKTALLKPWKQVQPALIEANLLTSHQFSRCAIDTSDGLKTSCRHIATASSVDIILDAESIPIGDGVHAVAEALGADPLTLACSDSVDFRLLYTVPPGKKDAMLAAFLEKGLTPYKIGHVQTSAGNAGKVFLKLDGRLQDMTGIEKIQ